MVLLAVLFLPAGAASAALVVADFDGSTAGTDNVTATNLNAGTTGGSWTATDPQESDIVADTVNGGNALFADRGPYDLSLAFGPYGSLSGIVVSYDSYIARTTNTANQKENYIVLKDSGGDELIRLALTTDGGGNDNLQGRLRYTSSSGNGVGTEVTLLDNLNSQGNDTFVPSRMQDYRIELSASTYDLYVDGARVGDDLAYRNPVTDLATISLLGSGGSDTTAAGAFFDSFSITAAQLPAVPEPSTFALAALGLLGLVGWRRRRK